MFKSKLSNILRSCGPFAIAFYLLVSSTTSHGQQLVLRGDYPDPSVVKIGNTYWASATSSNWFPAFPLLKSKDLVHWKQEGYIYNEMPDWADFYFWAPEITYDNGKVYVYYAAHKKGGNLCLGVASADNPAGPYTDHGPLMCEDAGSIDAFPMRDEKGKLYLIWKEDGNSVRKPTPIWAMEMSEDRTKLIGEKQELFRNQQEWEKNLVEGVSMMRHGEYFYAFYAAAGCCGAGCNYVTGVARSKTLLGPWEKYEKNPVLVNTDEWICPGHGTPVEKDGRYYFLHHAYDKTTNAFTGREGVLTEFSFNEAGWIDFKKQSAGVAKPWSVKDKFNGKLSQNWQWSVFQKVQKTLEGGKLKLAGLPEPSGAFVGQKMLTGNLSAVASVDARASTAVAGIAAIGDEKNTLSLQLSNDTLSVMELRNGVLTLLMMKVIEPSRNVHLKMDVKGGRYYKFSFSTNGQNYTSLKNEAIDGIFLPPWDRAVRIGLMSKGETSQQAVYSDFYMAGD